MRGSVYRLASKFLSDAPKVMSAFQVMSHFRFRFEIDVTGLHVAAFFGLDKLAKMLLKKGFALNGSNVARQPFTGRHFMAKGGS